MSKIFGVENFIDTNMISVEYYKMVDDLIIDKMSDSVKMMRPKISIDKEKLRKWIILCMKLENIEHSDLVDMATKKRIFDLEAQLAEKDEELAKYKLEDTAQLSDFIDQNSKKLAIAELEKLRENLKDEIKNAKELLDPIEYEEYHELLGVGRGYKNSIEYIDQQIKKIKGEKI